MPAPTGNPGSAPAFVTLWFRICLNYHKNTYTYAIRKKIVKVMFKSNEIEL